MKRSFFQAAVTSILLYGCTTWTLTKRLEKKLDGNYTRMLRANLNKSWRQHPTRHQLFGHLPPITKTIKVRRTRHAGHCWRSRDELISDVLLRTPTHGRAKAGRPARTYIHREKWRERVRGIRATSTTWWWWWYWRTIYNHWEVDLWFIIIKFIFEIKGCTYFLLLCFIFNLTVWVKDIFSYKLVLHKWLVLDCAWVTLFIVTA